jgi:hypothetical protein
MFAKVLVHMYLPMNFLRKGRDLYNKLYFINLQLCICKTSMLIFSLLIAYIYFLVRMKVDDVDGAYNCPISVNNHR